MSNDTRDRFKVAEGCFVVSSSGTSRSGAQMSILVDSFGPQSAESTKKVSETKSETKPKSQK